MYADRYARRTKLDPGSLGLSAAMVGLMVGGLIFSAPDFVTKIKDKGLKIIEVTEPPVPPPPVDDKPPPKPQQLEETKLTPPPFIPEQLVRTDSTPKVEFTSQPEIIMPSGEGTGTGNGGGEILTKPEPVIVGPQPARGFNYQPDYPSDERRLGREGRVVVRILVGTDGRVKQVEKISAASDSFFEATRRRALEKWRLTPGSKDGVPVEAWRTMAVRFVLNAE